MHYGISNSSYIHNGLSAFSASLQYAAVVCVELTLKGGLKPMFNLGKWGGGVSNRVC